MPNKFKGVKMLRILQIIGSLNIGGSQTMIMNIYRNIDKSKIQFDFIVDHKDHLYFAKEIEELGGHIYIMPTFKGINLMEIIYAWDKFFKDHPEYKIIHSHVRSYASIFLYIAKKNGLHTIIHSHSTSNGKNIKALIKGVLQFPLRYQADYFFACSNEAGKWLFGDKIVKSNKFKILNNCIDVNQYLPDERQKEKYKKKLGITGKTVIGHIGRLTYEKNHNKLLEVFEKYKNIDKDAVLLIVGDGEERKNIENKISKLDIKDSVILLGNRNDVPKLLQTMDLFVFPSYYEGLGIVLIEAQVANVKVIASDTIPKNTCISNNIEYVSLNKDANYWADKAYSLLNNKKRYELDKQKVEEFDINKQINKIEEFYLNINEDFR